MVQSRISIIVATWIVMLAACSTAEQDLRRDGSIPADGPVRDSVARVEGLRADGGVRDVSRDVVSWDLTPTSDVLSDILPADTTSPPDSNGKPEVHVFILAGQSNMVGLGENNQLSGDDARRVDDVTIYYNDGVHSNTNAEQWLPLEPGFGVNGSRFGPELAFGRRLRELWPGRKIAIIKVAEGGTSLSDDWTATSGHLYTLMMTEVKAELAAMYANWQPRLAGFVWMQGESDGGSLSDAQAYQGLLTTFINTMRQDLGAPGLPMVAGLISPHDAWPHAEVIRTGTAALTSLLPPMEVVEAADLPRHLDDTVHYDTTGNLALGKRFAEAMAAIHADAWNHEADFGANAYVGGWSYRYRLGNNAQPMTYDRTTERWGGPEASLLIGKGWMHPGALNAAELVWRAPRLLLMQVTLRAEAGDSRGGDGTIVEVAQDDQILWGPHVVSNNSHVEHAFQVLVQPGQELRFRTSAGTANNNDNDTTLWQLDIAYVSP